MTNSYTLRSPIHLTNSSFGLVFLRDEPSAERKRAIDFHITSGDYFGTVATVLGLIADSLVGADFSARKRYARELNDLRGDLAYVQDTHAIKPKA